MTITKFQSDLAPGLQRMMALGVYKSACVAEIRERGMPAAIEYAQTLGGVGSRCTGLARSILRAVEKVGNVPPKKIYRHETVRSAVYGAPQEIVVAIPCLSWKFAGDRQVAHFSWTPVRTHTPGDRPLCL